MDHADLAAASVINPNVPSIARVYDYVLGGALNFQCDRMAAKQVLRILPGYRDFALANRAFLHRGVRAMLEQGIRQFIDLGSGLPTVAPVHEVAHRTDPECRVVYVDNDPIAVAHSLLIVGDDDRLGVVESDMGDVDRVLDAPDTRRVLDPSRPIGVLMVGVLHFKFDSDDVVRILTAYHRRVTAGSMLLASHASGDALGPDMTEQAEKGFAQYGIQVMARTREEFEALLGPWQLTDDGVVETRKWRAESLAELNRGTSLGYAMMATHTGLIR
jgi:O-methyltransferase involved in polyketide biosynthesis